MTLAEIYSQATKDLLVADLTGDTLVVVNEGTAWWAGYKGTITEGVGYINDSCQCSVDYRTLVINSPCKTVRVYVNSVGTWEDKPYAKVLANVQEINKTYDDFKKVLESKYHYSQYPRYNSKVA